MTATTFLVVDDKLDNVLVLQTVLEKHFPKCKVLSAGSAQEGLALSAENSVDCGLIDVQMPRIDGIAMCKRLKANEATSHFPVILVTAHQSTAQSRTHALEAGADDFLSRPIDNIELVAKVNVMLRIKQAEDDLRTTNARLEERVAERTRSLRASEEKYKALFDQAGDYILVLESSSRGFPVIVDANESACRIHGYTREELVGKPIMELDTGLGEQRAREIGDQILSGEDVTYETIHQRRDETTFPVEVSASLVRVSGKPPFILSIERDITEREQMEEQLRHAQKMEAVGQLASGVAHEFNNLLFGILGSAELILAASKGELPEHFKRPLEDIRKCGQRGAALTKQLLAFARKKTSKVSVFDINQVVRDLDRMLRQVGGERITLETVLASDVPSVEADPGEIEQAILNLTRNACDAMPDGGTLTIRTAAERLDEVRLSSYPHARPGPYAQLSITDTGLGMSPETVERIFEPFFTTKPVGKGTGLGLSTVFVDVTESGGTIEVESRQGAGTEFRIYLPAADEETNVVAGDGVERSADRYPGGSETILVCDDDEVVLDSAASLLETRGYSAIRALGAGEALEAAASHVGTIELLLTDVTMPEMNGWQLAQELTRERPTMKVIFMSGYAEDVLKAGGAEGEHIEFLHKPPQLDTLFQRVREVLDASRRCGP